MQRILITVFFLFNFFSVIYSVDKTIKIYTWEDVLSEAKKHNPLIRSARESVNRSELNYKKSFSNFLPQFSFNLGKDIAGSEQSGKSENYSYGISGNISIFSGFSDINNLKLKEIELKTSEIEFRRIYSDVIYNLKKSFYNLLWAQEMVNLTKIILDKRIENYELVKFKYESGREDKGSLLRVEADKIQSEYEFNKAKRNLRTTYIKLIEDIGLDNYDIIVVTGSFIVNKPEEISSFTELIRQIPEYIIAKNNLQKVDYEIKIAESEFYPKISFSGSTSKFGDKWLPENSRWSIGLGLSYPFYSGGRNVYDLKIAKVDRIIAEQNLKEIEKQILSKIIAAYNSYIDAVENVFVREKYLEASEEQSKIRTVKYINGLISYQDWYITENDFINSQTALLNMKRDAIDAEAYWKNILGLGE
jgi:outer membrane protein TolC